MKPMRIQIHSYARLAGMVLATLVLYSCQQGSERPSDDTGLFAPDLRKAAKSGLESTVYIETLIESASQGDSSKRGSGVILTPDGYIITNYHVVSSARQILIRLYDKNVFEAGVVGVDSAYDLALIKVQAEQLPYLEFGNSDLVVPGEPVVAVGNPFVLNFTVTSGIISAKDRDLDSDVNATPNLLQTDVPINTGNSGGPLLNSRGELIGIVGMLLTISGQYEGYSFAIPSNLVAKVAHDLMHLGVSPRASIQMRIRNVSHDEARFANLPEVTGVIVDAIDEGGPADRAGLRSLDIILSVDSMPVESIAGFKGKLALYSPGDTMHITLNREGAELPAEVILDEKQE